ncbi:hypothetical protein NMY22_g11245 [Coprinellus aureogranulatus]|nr:hypothetical protein NMY22_g11245 [Coprinellus aureogranulatus]
MVVAKTARVQHDSPRKNRFIGMVQAGRSVAQAARDTSLPSSTAYDLWNKFKQTGTTHNQPRSGRPKKVGTRLKRQVIRTALQDTVGGTGKDEFHARADSVRRSAAPHRPGWWGEDCFGPYFPSVLAIAMLLNVLVMLGSTTLLGIWGDPSKKKGESNLSPDHCVIQIDRDTPITRGSKSTKRSLFPQRLPVGDDDVSALELRGVSMHPRAVLLDFGRAHIQHGRCSERKSAPWLGIELRITCLVNSRLEIHPCLSRLPYQERRKPFTEIANELPEDISTSTVRNLLAEEGYHRCVARKVPFLKRYHKLQRLRWARKYKKFTRRDWRKPIWSDECYIYLGDDRGRVYVTRRPDEEHDENCLVPRFTQSSIRVMVWGCIAKGRKGPLVVLEYPGGRGGGMNTQRYISQVLEPQLKPFFEKMKKERRGPIFQQDGASCHKSKTTLRWLASNGIPLMDHPSKSPDVSPIEPVWLELKKMLRARPRMPTSVGELITAVKECWERLAIADIDKYIDSMPQRVDAVIEAKGGHTRY